MAATAGILPGASVAPPLLGPPGGDSRSGLLLQRLRNAVTAVKARPRLGLEHGSAMQDRMQVLAVAVATALGDDSALGCGSVLDHPDLAQLLEWAALPHGSGGAGAGGGGDDNINSCALGRSEPVELLMLLTASIAGLPEEDLLGMAQQLPAALGGTPAVGANTTPASIAGGMRVQLLVWAGGAAADLMSCGQQKTGGSSSSSEDVKPMAGKVWKLLPGSIGAVRAALGRIGRAMWEGPVVGGTPDTVAAPVMTGTQTAAATAWRPDELLQLLLAAYRRVNSLAAGPLVAVAACLAHALRGQLPTTASEGAGVSGAARIAAGAAAGPIAVCPTALGTGWPLAQLMALLGGKMVAQADGCRFASLCTAVEIASQGSALAQTDGSDGGGDEICGPDAIAAMRTVADAVQAWLGQHRALLESDADVDDFFVSVLSDVGQPLAAAGSGCVDLAAGVGRALTLVHSPEWRLPVGAAVAAVAAGVWSPETPVAGTAGAVQWAAGADAGRVQSGSEGEHRATEILLMVKALCQLG